MGFIISNNLVTNKKAIKKQTENIILSTNNFSGLRLFVRGVKQLQVLLTNWPGRSVFQEGISFSKHNFKKLKNT